MAHPVHRGTRPDPLVVFSLTTGFTFVTGKTKNTSEQQCQSPQKCVLCAFMLLVREGFAAVGLGNQFPVGSTPRAGAGAPQRTVGLHTSVNKRTLQKGIVRKELSTCTPVKGERPLVKKAEVYP